MGAAVVGVAVVVAAVVGAVVGDVVVGASVVGAAVGVVDSSPEGALDGISVRVPYGVVLVSTLGALL